jgi:hypothetical protein
LTINSVSFFFCPYTQGKPSLNDFGNVLYYLCLRLFYVSMLKEFCLVSDDAEK